MSKFEHLKKQDVAGDKTIEYVMNQLVGEPVLHVLPATESNKPFWNATLRALNKKKNYNKRNVTAGMIEQNRKDDKDMYPLYVIKGWDNMLDGKGGTIPYTAEDCVDFVNSLPDYIFDALRDFVTDNTNFVDFLDVDELVGN